MSKKVVILLSILAIVFAGAATGLWFTVKGKTEQANASLAALSEFSAGSTFEARLQAPAKARAAIDTLRDEGKQKDETIASRDAKISGLEHDKKDLESNVDELNGRVADLTRTGADLRKKSEEVAARADSAEARVKDLEGQIVRQSEEFVLKEKQLRGTLSADTGSLVANTEKARQYYAQLYNFATSKGLVPPLSARPWESEAANSAAGPTFTRMLVAEVVGFDARQGIAVLNIGSEAGLHHDEGFDLLVGDNVVGKVAIKEVINTSLSSVTFTAGSDVPNLTVGSAVKLAPAGAIKIAPAATE